MEQAQEYIVTKEIISHLSRFLKNDSASGGTCYYKPIFFLILISTKMHFLLVSILYLPSKHDEISSLT